MTDITNSQIDTMLSWIISKLGFQDQARALFAMLADIPSYYWRDYIPPLLATGKKSPVEANELDERLKTAGYVPIGTAEQLLRDEAREYLDLQKQVNSASDILREIIAECAIESDHIAETSGASKLENGARIVLSIAARLNAATKRLVLEKRNVSDQLEAERKGVVMLQERLRDSALAVSQLEEVVKNTNAERRKVENELIKRTKQRDDNFEYLERWRGWSLEKVQHFPNSGVNNDSTARAVLGNAINLQVQDSGSIRGWRTWADNTLHQLGMPPYNNDGSVQAAINRKISELFGYGAELEKWGEWAIGKLTLLKSSKYTGTTEDMRFELGHQLSKLMDKPCEFNNGCVHADDLLKIAEGKEDTHATTDAGLKAMTRVRKMMRALEAMDAATFPVRQEIRRAQRLRGDAPAVAEVVEERDLIREVMDRAVLNYGGTDIFAVDNFVQAFRETTGSNDQLSREAAMGIIASRSDVMEANIAYSPGRFKLLPKKQ